MVEVDDDRVLCVMSELGLEAEHLPHFRVVRHCLAHGMPPCCVSFMLHFIRPSPFLPDDVTEALLSDDGLLGQYARAGFVQLQYVRWAYKAARKAKIKLRYTPCPACVLAGRFVKMPKGCPCCKDRELHPDPEEPPPKAEENKP